MECKKPREQHIGKWACILLCVSVFAFMFVFFFKIHPLMMHDGDDWAYSTFKRRALPQWGGWNPARVLPELISPLAAYMAAFLVMPFLGDLCWSMALVYALIFSAAITVYVAFFVRFVHRRFALPRAESAALGLLFFISHFLILRGKVVGNVHMFYSASVCTYFFYTLPDLVGTSLVLYMAADPGRSFAIDRKRPLKNGCCFVLLYMAVFSNLYCNYIVTIYAGLVVLARLYRALREKKSILSALSDCAWLVIVLVLWIVCAIFELSGGRAASFATQEPFIDRLKGVYGGLLSVVDSLNPLFTVVCLLLVAAGGICFCLPHRKRDYDGATGESIYLLLTGFLLSVCYLVLLTTKTGAGYITQPNVFFGAAFYMLLLVMCATAYLLRRFPSVAVILPALCIVFYAEIDTRWSTFKEPSMDNLTANECHAINHALMDQMLEFDALGEQSVGIEVPPGPYWYIADHMSVALYKLGVIEHEMYAWNVEIDDFFEKYAIREVP